MDGEIRSDVFTITFTKCRHSPQQRAGFAVVDGGRSSRRHDIVFDLKNEVHSAWRAHEVGNQTISATFSQLGRLLEVVDRRKHLV